jgi:sugar transferase EpsL
MVLFLPIMLLTSPLVWIFLGTPILFRQQRPGYRGKPFITYKFRTMTDRRGRDGNLLPDSERLTRFGRFLRSTSIDDLPQLFNVLRGEMSLVGPRPLLMKYLELYTPEQRRRHDGLPGITGWAQVNGRNALSWDERFRLDVWYVDHWSFWLDIKILFMTLGTVVRRKGISQPGHVTAEEFKGSTHTGK